MRRPYVIGHRGGIETAPENTLGAFRSAADYGADEIELDIRCTCDGELIVMHDATVDRTTNGTGRVRSMTIEEVCSLDAGDGMAPPMYADVVSSIDLPLQTEIKDVRDVEVFARWIDRTGNDHPTTIASADPEILREARRLMPTIPRTIFLKQSPGDAADRAAAVEATWAFLGSATFSGAVIRRCRAAGFRVGTWPVGDPATLCRAMDQCIEAVLTDYPQFIRSRSRC